MPKEYRTIQEVAGPLMLVKGVEAVSEQEPLDIVVPINQIDAFVNFVNAFEKNVVCA